MYQFNNVSQKKVRETSHVGLRADIYVAYKCSTCKSVTMKLVCIIIFRKVKKKIYYLDITQLLRENKLKWKKVRDKERLKEIGIASLY